MKKIILISAILFCAVCYNAEAQVSVNINIGSQPAWGPVGYNYVNYYYLPDLGVYYDVPRGQFVYFEFDRWNFGPALPPEFGNYDLYRSYKVVVNDRNPWMRDTYYRDHYSSYRGRYQPVIRDSRDSRYFVGRERYNDRRGDRYEQRRDDKYYKHDNGVRDHGRGKGRDDHDHGHGNDHGHGRDHDH